MYDENIFWAKMDSNTTKGDELIKTDDIFVEENETHGNDCELHDNSNSTCFHDSFYSGTSLK